MADAKNVSIKEGKRSYSFATIERLATDTISDYEAYWVLPPSSTTLFASENGQYDAADNGVACFTSVVVNVAGGVGAAPAGAPTFNDTDKLVDDGWQEPWGEADYPTAGEVAGLAPDGGYETVGTEGGKLDDQLAPMAIGVKMPPRRTTYLEGETIDYTGLVVAILGQDGEFSYRDDRYPSGEIPMSELEFPCTTASDERGVVDVSSLMESDPTLKRLFERLGTHEIETTRYVLLEVYGKKLNQIYHRSLYECTRDVKMIVNWNHSVYDYTRIFACSLGDEGVVRKTSIDWRYKGDGTIASGYPKFKYDTYEIDGATNYEGAVFYGLQITNRRQQPYINSYYVADPDITSAVYPSADRVKVMAAALFGQARTVVPVRWTDPYTGKVLETHFDIQLLQPND